MKATKKRPAIFLFALFLALLSLQISNAPASAVDLTFTSVGTVSVSGYGTVGATLTASEGSWNPTPTSFTYQWKRDGADIAGANSRSYQVVGDDFGSNVTVAITAHKSGYTDATSVASSYYGVGIYGRASLSNTPSPVVDGTPQVGEYVFANTQGWDSGVSFTYQWYANGYQIYGATSYSYQLQSQQKNARLTVTVTGSKKGYYSSTQSSSSSDYVKPAVPKITWTSSYGQLTGKNNLIAKADLAYGSTSFIRTWCLTRDTIYLDLAVGAKGVYFVDSSGASITPTALGAGCYTSSFSNIQNLRLRVDVTDWGVGSHTIFATAKDADGMISASTALSLYVAKTAPTFTGDFSSISQSVADTFQFSGLTTTHSQTAPVSEWCLLVDGQPVPKIEAATFKSTAGSASVSSFSSLGSHAGCLAISGNGDLAQGNISLDSKLFANGTHELTVRVRSFDGDTSWWSDPVKTSFKSKNKYIPNVTWNRSNSYVAVQGTPSKIGGSIGANIPGAPGLLTLSTVNSDGTFTKFFDSSNSNIFNAAPLLQKNTNIQLEIFDEDKVSVLTEVTEIHIAPKVTLAKPKIALTVSTVSTAVTKTVTLSVSTSKLPKASCKASWVGGSKVFTAVNGAGKVVFVPSGSGSVSVTCSAPSMVASRPVAVRY